VKSLKKFGLNLSLKVWFEKSLKKKKKKTYLLTLSARRPNSPPIFPLQRPTPPAPFSFLFLSLTSRSHRSDSPRRLPFFFPSSPSPGPAPPQIPPRPAAFPFLSSPLESTNQGSIHSRFQSGRFPFLSPCPR
jgi:hypothetical protein